MVLSDVSDSLRVLLIFAIPIIAIIGGITMGIVKVVSRQRLQELARRERIAAIEKGVDLSQLPPMPFDAEDQSDYARSTETNRTRQGLLIGGLITLFAGIGLGLMLNFLAHGEDAWAVGFVPGFVGFAMLLSYWLTKPPANSGMNRTPGSPSP